MEGLLSGLGTALTVVHSAGTLGPGMKAQHRSEHRNQIQLCSCIRSPQGAEGRSLAFSATSLRLSCDVRRARRPRGQDEGEIVASLLRQGPLIFPILGAPGLPTPEGWHLLTLSPELLLREVGATVSPTEKSAARSRAAASGA